MCLPIIRLGPLDPAVASALLSKSVDVIDILYLLCLEFGCLASVLDGNEGAES
jgi:hypothetical protein